MLERDNYLRNARMQGPQWIPAQIIISGASWREHGQAMADVVRRHPGLFRDMFSEGADLDYIDLSFPETETPEFTDTWGCVWQRGIAGLEGVVNGHPLADWADLPGYRAPDPLVDGDRGPANWAQIAVEIARRRAAGEAISGGPPHGFFFDRLTYLRGFENCMLDLATGDARLPALIDVVMAHNRALVDQWLSLGIDVLELADDLGAQTASMISPRLFRRWLAPGYAELARKAANAGALVAFHSDGYTMNLMDDFLALGVDIVNPQDLVNGIDDLAREVKGRACIRLDIDRQTVVPFGTRAEIRDLIEEEVRKLGDPRGGLEFIAGIYPPTTPDRVDALASALAEFRTYWWDGRGG